MGIGHCYFSGTCAPPLLHSLLLSAGCCHCSPPILGRQMAQERAQGKRLVERPEPRLPDCGRRIAAKERGTQGLGCIIRAPLAIIGHRYSGLCFPKQADWPCWGGTVRGTVGVPAAAQHCANRRWAPYTRIVWLVTHVTPPKDPYTWCVWRNYLPHSLPQLGHTRYASSQHPAA